MNHPEHHIYIKIRNYIFSDVPAVAKNSEAACAMNHHHHHHLSKKYAIIFLCETLITFVFLFPDSFVNAAAKMMALASVMSL